MVSSPDQGWRIGPRHCIAVGLPSLIAKLFVSLLTKTVNVLFLGFCNKTLNINILSFNDSYDNFFFV